MKSIKLKSWVICISILIATGLYAQESIKYQVVLYDLYGNLIKNEQVFLKISLLEDNLDGLIAYKESHKTTTDDNGRATIMIGKGSDAKGFFEELGWNKHNYYIQLDFASERQKEYLTLATIQVLTIKIPGETSIVAPIQSTKSVDQPKYYLGEKYGGGVIFYIDETGEHGLIASPDDIGYIDWGCKKKKSGATSLTDGILNTNNIVAQCGVDNAAGLCFTLDTNGFSDWYLPSQYELRLLFDQRGKVPGLKAGDYCSSSEYYPSNESWNDAQLIDCWVIQFGREGKLIHYHKETSYFVRAIRKF